MFRILKYLVVQGRCKPWAESGGGAKSFGSKQPLRNARSSVWRGRVWLGFRISVSVALAGFALYWAGSKVSRPFTLLSSTSREVRETDAKLQSIRAENEGLRRSIAFMNTPEGKARAGRWSGLVKPGERRLMIPEDIDAGSR